MTRGSTPKDAGTVERRATSVLFVCLGNICRSPMAHAVFEHFVAALPSSCPPIKVDSAGTGAYHVLSPPDPRTMATLEAHGVHEFDHAARQVLNADFENYDYILAMDSENFKDLRRRCRRSKALKDAEQRLFLFGDFDYDREVSQGWGEDIEDPYYGGDAGFETAFQQCVRFSRGWLRDVLGYDVNIDTKGNVAATDPKLSADGSA